MVEFIPVITEEQIKNLAFMADTVWHEFFPGIITEEQIDYMIRKFQSFAAIKKQISEGYDYFFVNVNGINVGYTGVHIENDTGKMFVSKVYLLKSYRGKKYATEIFKFLEGMCGGMQIKSMYLTVNKHNDHAVSVYKKIGFETVDTQVADIGNGFVMDDYIMEKVVNIK